jgi:hypothetical protein
MKLVIIVIMDLKLVVLNVNGQDISIITNVLKSAQLVSMNKKNQEPVNHVTLLVVVASMELITVVTVAQKIIISITILVLTFVQSDISLITLPVIVNHVTIHVIAVLKLLHNVKIVKKDSIFTNNNVCSLAQMDSMKIPLITKTSVLLVTNLAQLVMPVTDLLLVNVLLVPQDHVTTVNNVLKVYVDIQVLSVTEILLSYPVLLSVMLVQMVLT